MEFKTGRENSQEGSPERWRQRFAPSLTIFYLTAASVVQVSIDEDKFREETVKALTCQQLGILNFTYSTIKKGWNTGANVEETHPHKQR